MTRTLRLGKAATVGRRKPDYNPRFLATWNARWPYQILRPEVVERLDLHAEYMETARYDAPYRRINEFILEHTLSEPYIATRLEDCTLVAASYGVDYRWPLLDVRLVQQYLSTPSVEKMGPKGIGRYLHRRAVAGVVPPRVAWKPSKDMGYARRRRETGDAGMAQVADHARQLEAQLHPGLDDLIDRPKLREQIGRAAHSRGDDEFAFSFQRSFGALRWLDRWLKDEPAV